MEAVFSLGLVAGTTLLCATGTKAAWQRGWKRPVILTFLAVLALVALFFYLSTIARGSYLAGLGEVLIALALLAGPAAGIVLGVIAARSVPLAIGVAALSLCVIVLLGSRL